MRMSQWINPLELEVQVVEQQEEIVKSYYSISEVAERLALSPSLIRFWESEFEMLQPRKNKKGNRIYTEADIAMICEIQYLVKDRRYTLEGAREKLRSGREKVAANLQTRETLLKLRRFLERLRDGV